MTTGGPGSMKTPTSLHLFLFPNYHKSRPRRVPTRGPPSDLLRKGISSVSRYVTRSLEIVSMDPIDNPSCRLRTLNKFLETWYLPPLNPKFDHGGTCECKRQVPEPLTITMSHLWHSTPSFVHPHDDVKFFYKLWTCNKQSRKWKVNEMKCSTDKGWKNLVFWKRTFNKEKPDFIQKILQEYLSTIWRQTNFFEDKVGVEILYQKDQYVKMHPPTPKDSKKRKEKTKTETWHLSY